MSVEPSAFVAGATGYVGREVVRVIAQERSIATVAHVRPDSRRLAEWRDRMAAAGASVDTTEWDAAAMTDTLVRLRPTMLFALLGTDARAGTGGGRARRHRDVRDGGLRAHSLLLRAAAAAARETGVRPASSTSPAWASPRAPQRVSRRALARGAGAARQRAAVRDRATRPDHRPRPRGATARRASRRGRAERGAVAGRGARRRALRERYRPTTSTVLAQALVRLALDPDATAAVVESEGLRLP